MVKPGNLQNCVTEVVRAAVNPSLYALGALILYESTGQVTALQIPGISSKDPPPSPWYQITIRKSWFYDGYYLLLNGEEVPKQSSMNLVFWSTLLMGSTSLLGLAAYLYRRRYAIDPSLQPEMNLPTRLHSLKSRLVGLMYLPVQTLNLIKAYRSKTTDLAITSSAGERDDPQVRPLCQTISETPERPKSDSRRKSLRTRRPPKYY